MRVLVMSHAWVPDTGAGAQTAGHDLMRAVVEAGHQVDVLLSQNRGPAEVRVQDGITIYPYRDTGDPFHWFDNPPNRPHVVVSHLESTLRAAVLSRMNKIPHVHLLHNDMGPTKFAVLEGPSELVVYNTHWMRDSVRHWLIFVQDVVPGPDIVVHPPIRAEEFRTTPGDRITQVNLFVGTKNPQVFYEMAKRFPEKKFLGVIGAYGEQLIIDMPNIDLIGPFTPADMREKVYSRTKVLLQPSVYESYGRCAVEAACSGIPVLAGDTPGLREALGEEGTFIAEEDYDRWENELHRALSPRGWSSASARARRVADQLTTEEDLARFVTALEAVALKDVPPREILHVNPAVR